MRRVVFTPKGGVGKTSIACNLAAISAHKGFRTLMIDLDPQGNATSYLTKKQASDFELSIEDFFKQAVSFTFNKNYQLSELISLSAYPNLDVLPSSQDLDLLTAKLESRQKIYKLKEALKALEQDYDHIYIDTQPCFNFYTRSALIAADRCLVPFDCDKFSCDALFLLLNEISEISDDHNPDLFVEGIVANQFLPRATLPTKLIRMLKQQGLPVLSSYLTTSVKMRESHDTGRPLINLAPKHKLTKNFLDLFEELHFSRFHQNCSDVKENKSKNHHLVSKHVSPNASSSTNGKHEGLSRIEENHTKTEDDHAFDAVL